MHLQLKPSKKSNYPIIGLLIKGESLDGFWGELERMDIQMSQAKVWPVPGMEANKLWGYYVETSKSLSTKVTGPHQWVQNVEGVLLLAERTEVYPKLASAECAEITKGNRVLAHPEFGFYELEEPIDLSNHIMGMELQELNLRIPEDEGFVPQKLLSFEIQPIPSEDVLKKLEKAFPAKKTLEDKPLNLLEKTRLKLYEGLFKKGNGDEKPQHASGEGGDMRPGILTNLGKGLAGLGSRLFGNMGKKLDGMFQDFEELQRRNQKEVDRFLSMLKRNPEDALQYAIPLDEQGTERGDAGLGLFGLSRLWSNFSLFGSNAAMGSGGGIDLGDNYYTLRQQYEETAKLLKEKGDYEKAAFVYLKLLKNPLLAAQTLEEGGLYAEAAAIYLKHLKDKKAAANAYSKGLMYHEAIKLYDELQEYETAGDLSMKIHQKKQAFSYYELVAENLIKNYQYVKASLLYKNKMEKPGECQDLLLKGWRENKDSTNCLNTYFSNVSNEGELARELIQLGEEEKKGDRRRAFLSVVIRQNKHPNSPKQVVRNLAYELVSLEAKQHPEVVAELIALNNTDKEFTKDTFRYKAFSRSNTA